MSPEDNDIWKLAFETAEREGKGVDLVNIHAHSQREACPDAGVQVTKTFEKQIYPANKNLCSC